MPSILKYATYRKMLVDIIQKKTMTLKIGARKRLPSNTILVRARLTSTVQTRAIAQSCIFVRHFSSFSWWVFIFLILRVFILIRCKYTQKY